MTTPDASPVPRLPLVLFPSRPFAAREVDEDFAHEQAAARAAGLDTALIDVMRPERGFDGAALARVPRDAGLALYRGWMVRPEEYAALFAALNARGVALINPPEAYRTCHYLPESYALLGERTPRSVWLELGRALDWERITAELARFGDRAVIVKDYVKSQKHYWEQACFIPAASDRAAVERVVRRFLELQGDGLNVGLVFREYVPLKIVGTHPKSGMPLAAEFRVFWLDGEPLLAHRYWGDLTTFEEPLPFAELAALAARIPSRCFTMDVAFLEDGGWTVVELGDGQVAGLPSPELAPAFYGRLTQLSSKFRL